MNSKLDQIDRMVKRGGGRGRGSGGSNGALETLAQESFDILTLIPTYIENTKEAIGVLSEETKVNYMLLIVHLHFWKNKMFKCSIKCSMWSIILYSLEQIRGG